MRAKKGVSLIDLVLVIIIILIIATFSVFSGRQTLDQATATEVYTEINGIRSAINSINIKKDMDEKFVFTESEHYDIKASNLSSSESDFEATYGIDIATGEFDNLYIIYGMDELEKYNLSKVKDSYGLDSIKHTYIVNFDEGKVDLLENITIANKSVRTFEQVRALVDNGEL